MDDDYTYVLQYVILKHFFKVKQLKRQILKDVINNNKECDRHIVLILKYLKIV